MIYYIHTNENNPRDDVLLGFKPSGDYALVAWRKDGGSQWIVDRKLIRVDNELTPEHMEKDNKMRRATTAEVTAIILQGEVVE